MAAAFVLVYPLEGEDVSKPLVARSYARKSNGYPSISEAFGRVHGEKTGAGEEPPPSSAGTTYVLSDDSVLLMIGQTEELVKECKAAHDTEPRIVFIQSEFSSLQLRYVRIQVHAVSKQTDTLIALGAKLPAISTDGWHEPKGWKIEWPTIQNFVTTADVKVEVDDHSLPGWIRAIKENDGKKWIDA
jgi:hypothetical protein